MGEQRYAIDPSRANRELEWEPTTMFADGIKRPIQWYRDEVDWKRHFFRGTRAKAFYASTCPCTELVSIFPLSAHYHSESPSRIGICQLYVSKVDL